MTMDGYTVDDEERDYWMRYVKAHDLQHHRTMKQALDEAPYLDLAAGVEVAGGDPAALMTALEDLQDLYNFPVEPGANLKGLADLIDW